MFNGLIILIPSGARDVVERLKNIVKKPETGYHTEPTAKNHPAEISRSDIAARL
jgi:hypothetical protein